MSNPNAEIIGKPVKDMYGSLVGTTVGTLTDIDGSVHTVGVDCGHSGLMQIPYSQLVVQDNVIIFIPKWRLNSQKMLREKGMTLRRLGAIIDIVSDNDEMKEDASLVHAKYRAKLNSFEPMRREIDADLNSRLSQLDEQIKAIKIIVFDARIQSKSGEMAETAFSTVCEQTKNLEEHMQNEISEIKRVSSWLQTLPSNFWMNSVGGKAGEGRWITALMYTESEADAQALKDVLMRWQAKGMESTNAPDLIQIGGGKKN